MKVGRWKVLGLAGVLAIGYVATSEAAQIKVSNDTFANFGINMKIWYNNMDKRDAEGDHRANVFSVGQTKIYFSGQVTPLFRFWAELDNNRPGAFLRAPRTTEIEPGNTTVGEAAVNLAFAREFQVAVGRQRKPFSQSYLASGYAQLIPSDFCYNPHGTKDSRVQCLFTWDRTDFGAVVRGDLAGGMFTYRLGLFNNDRRITDNRMKDFEFVGRIEFQPLMLGFKPESAATITGKTADTRLGARDFFVIGLGYISEKRRVLVNGVPTDQEKTVDGWAVDARFEKKFGDVVPNLQIGYIKRDDTHKVGTEYKDTTGWYVEGQLLFDQVMGFGKPAIAMRFDTTEADKAFGTKDGKYQRWGTALNYYIRGQAARISLGFDNVRYKDGSKDRLVSAGQRTNLTDWYLYFQSQF